MGKWMQVKGKGGHVQGTGLNTIPAKVLINCFWRTKFTTHMLYYY